MSAPDPIADLCWQLAVLLDEFQAKHDAEMAALRAEIAELQENSATYDLDVQ